MNFIRIDKKNFVNLSSIIDGLLAQKASIVEIGLTRDKKSMPEVKDVLPYFLGITRYANDLHITIKDIPPCLLPGIEDRFLCNEPSDNKRKILKCRRCRYENICGGINNDYLEIYGDRQINFIKDLPREIMIELEPRCNFNCSFCFNKNSFALHGRNRSGRISDIYAKKIIRAIADSGVKIVRFTGGEPMLRKSLWELMDFARNVGLKLRLNTNGSLITSKKIVQRLNNYVSSILLPIHSASDIQESELTGFKGALKRKIRTISLLKEYSTMTVRAGTVITHDTLDNLDAMFDLLIKGLKLNDWEFYRPIPFKKKELMLSRRDIQILVDKLISFRHNEGRLFRIANALPFCVYDKAKVSSISRGALPVDGHIRYVIDPRGYAKPDYYIDKNIGDPLDILSCWNQPFMKKMRNLKFVPDECRNCEYLLKCRGGSRFMAKFFFGSFKAKDPLAGYDPM